MLLYLRVKILLRSDAHTLCAFLLLFFVPEIAHYTLRVLTGGTEAESEAEMVGDWTGFVRNPAYVSNSP